MRYEDSSFVRYGDDPWTDAKDAGFEEYYDLNAEPHQVRNKAFYGTVSPRTLDKARERLSNLRGCRSEGCRLAEGFPAP